LVLYVHTCGTHVAVRSFVEDGPVLFNCKPSHQLTSRLFVITWEGFLMCYREMTDYRAAEHCPAAHCPKLMKGSSAPSRHTPAAQQQQQQQQ